MAPKYKLTYFNGIGAAEPLRFLLSYMGEDFEDIRVDPADWQNKKSSTPFGKLPYLEVDGKILTQSIAIARYLGKKAGLAGKDDWENVQIDIMADTIVDMRLPISTFLMERDADKKNTLKEAYLKDTASFYLKKLDAIVKENAGYLANKKLSWADFVFTALMDFVSIACGVPDITADYPNLLALRKKILSLPQIKKWVEKRPKTPF
ncbi:hypothetical protein J6590_049684 [Homalodisca vitripennis]|nr:hypothetical protein J6590_049684 [Homalodisca vitripennis]